LQGGPHEGQPSIGTSKDPRGSAFVNGQHVPFRCTPEEVAALNANPRVTWSATSEDPYLGIIRYNIKTKEERYADLASICDWYNAQPPDSEAALPVRAGGAQHRLVSWHALGYDYNGRVSRDVLNWSLMNDYGLGSAPFDFDRDLFLTEEESSKEVALGVLRYHWAKMRIEKGIIGTDIIPGVYERRPFYNRFLADSIAVPTFRGEGEWQDHEPFDYFSALIEAKFNLHQWRQIGITPEETDFVHERFLERVLRHDT
jgi:hypothetical protein